jgi:hypothetical protein
MSARAEVADSIAAKPTATPVIRNFFILSLPWIFGPSGLSG